MIATPANETYHYGQFPDFRMTPVHRSRLQALYEQAGFITEDESPKTKYLARRMGITWHDNMDLKQLERQFAYQYL